MGDASTDEDLNDERARAVDVVRTCARSIAKTRMLSSPPPPDAVGVLVDITVNKHTAEMLLPTRPRELLGDTQILLEVALDGVTINEWLILYDGGGMAVHGFGDVRVVLDDD